MNLTRNMIERMKSADTTVRSAPEGMRLSTTAWALHNLGLAATIGGNLFGQTAFHPALREVSDPRERDRASDTAWRRYSWISMASHAAVAATWLTGRAMLSGGEVSRRARTLTRTKDVLVGVSLATSVASMVLGRALGRRVREGRGAETARATNGNQGDELERSRALDKAVNTVSALNLVANAGVAVVTTMLAGEASQSHSFAMRSKKLP